MYDQFLRYIEKEHLVAKGQRVLLAVSGGRDSVALCHLVARAGFPFAIAHCNFHLRPGDCDRDEEFVRSLADSYRVPCYVAQFDTNSYASDNHLSIEEAARNLRYAFFEEVRQHNGYDLIVTAHHRDDTIETFFINLLRGTGISGLCGIPARNGNVVRPMLPFGRDDINRYVSENNLAYVDDATNFQPLYLRNRIRLQLIPLLRQLSPSFDTTMQDNIARLTDASMLYGSAVEAVRQRIVFHGDGRVSIPIDELNRLSPLNTYIYELLRPFGFSPSTAAQIAESLKSQSGKQFFSHTHRLVKDRNLLLVSPLVGEMADDIIVQRDSLRDDVATPFVVPVNSSCLKLQVKSTFAYPPHLETDEAWFDFEQLRFPLTVRRWHHGDRFVPFGMKGSRLVSDLFSDLKMSLVDKENSWILCDATGTILWVVGLRAAAVARVHPATKKVLQCRFVK